VEFALVVPLLLLLVFGIISYGYLLSFRQALSQAAAEGARAAAVAVKPTPPAADTRPALALAAVDEALASYGVACGSPALTCTATPGTTCSCITVTLDYNYDLRPLTPDFPGLGLVMPDHLVYTASTKVS
jgi:Flp pilus assembly protein TadG